MWPFGIRLQRGVRADSLSKSQIGPLEPEMPENSRLLPGRVGRQPRLSQQRQVSWPLMHVSGLDYKAVNDKKEGEQNGRSLKVVSGVLLVLLAAAALLL